MSCKVSDELRGLPVFGEVWFNEKPTKTTITMVCLSERERDLLADRIEEMENALESYRLIIRNAVIGS